MRKTKDGRSRCFAFIGFRTDADAKKAVSELNRTYFDTGKIGVEFAHAPGASELARPWSRHAKGSSAQEKAHPELYEGMTKKKKVLDPASEAGAGAAVKGHKGPAPVAAPKGARVVQMSSTEKLEYHLEVVFRRELSSLILSLGSTLVSNAGCR